MKRLLNITFISVLLLFLGGGVSPAAGVMYDITLLPELPDWPVGYNDYGEYAEESNLPNPDDPECCNPHALLHHKDGTGEHLWTLYGDDLTITDLNNAQHIVGSCDYNHVIDEGQAFIWVRGSGMTWLGSLAGTNTHFSIANAINNLDQIVGLSWTADYDDAAFYWDDTSGLQNLNDLIPQESGWYLADARNINDAGQIAGQGTYLENPAFFLLTPIPIPPTFLLLAGGILFLSRRKGWGGR